MSLQSSSQRMSAPGAGAAPHTGGRRRFAWAPYIWIGPALALLAAFTFYPIFFTTGLSFFKWDGFGPSTFNNFVGLQNYIELIQDRLFLMALRNTLLFVLAVTTVQIVLALMLAIFIYLGEFHGAGLLRGIIFFPSVLSAVVVGIIWRNVVFQRGGLINQITMALGLPDFFPMGDPSLAFFVIILVAIWQGTGFNLVIFYAGLQSLDQELIEAAQIDGAGLGQIIRRIIIPLQGGLILINVVLNLIGGFQVFDLVFVLSRGPMIYTHVTDVLSTYLIFNSFGSGSIGGGRSALGYAAAIAVVMMLLMLVFAILRNRLRRLVEQ